MAGSSYRPFAASSLLHIAARIAFAAYGVLHLMELCSTASSGHVWHIAAGLPSCPAAHAAPQQPRPSSCPPMGSSLRVPWVCPSDPSAAPSQQPDPPRCSPATGTASSAAPRHGWDIHSRLHRSQDLGFGSHPAHEFVVRQPRSLPIGSWIAYAWESASHTAHASSYLGRHTRGIIGLGYSAWTALGS